MGKTGEKCDYGTILVTCIFCYVDGERWEPAVQKSGFFSSVPISAPSDKKEWGLLSIMPASILSAWIEQVSASLTVACIRYQQWIWRCIRKDLGEWFLRRIYLCPRVIKRNLQGIREVDARYLIWFTFRSSLNAWRPRSFSCLSRSSDLSRWCSNSSFNDLFSWNSLWSDSSASSFWVMSFLFWVNNSCCFDSPLSASSLRYSIRLPDESFWWYMCCVRWCRPYIASLLISARAVRISIPISSKPVTKPGKKASFSLSSIYSAPKFSKQYDGLTYF